MKYKKKRTTDLSQASYSILPFNLKNGTYKYKNTKIKQSMSFAQFKCPHQYNFLFPLKPYQHNLVCRKISMLFGKSK